MRAHRVNAPFAKRVRCLPYDGTEAIMKTKRLFSVLFAASILALSFTTRANDGDYAQGDCQTNGYCETNGYCTNDCDINGSEQMYAVVVLEPTTNAPTGSLGIAEINSDNYCGNETAAIDLKTFALTPGEYDLVVSLAAEGTNVTIGQFDVETNDYGGQGG